MTSTARVEANRRNAAKSTGPRTEAGKSRSRLNALKHGLRAEQVVLPGEDAGAFEAERQAFLDEWRPTTATRAVLVERLAAGAWRLRRCVRVEAARLSRIVREAAVAHDDKAWESVEDDLFLLDKDPARGVEALMSSREGCDQLYGRWEALVEAIRRPGGWDDPAEHHFPLVRLRGQQAGRRPTELDDVARLSWRLTVTDRPDALGATRWDDPDGSLSEPLPADRVDEARAALLRVAEREMEAILDRYESLPDTDADRARAIDACAQDDSPEGRALHRYEMMHDRAFRANLAQLVRLVQAGADPIGPEQDAGPVEAVEAGPPAPNEPNAPRPEPPGPGPDAPVRRPDPPDRAVGRPSDPPPRLMAGPDGPMSLPSCR